MGRLIVGNWKMNGTRQESRRWLGELKIRLADPVPGVEVVICPPFTALADAAEQLRGSVLQLGAQDTHWESRGAYTGSISAEMLAEVGCRYIIIGHSERRRYDAETDEIVARKLQACWRVGLHPILCVGESTPERKAGMTVRRLGAQVRLALCDPLTHGPVPVASLTVAYEPIWAIGTGLAAAPVDCAQGLEAISAELKRLWGAEAAARVVLLYGGSVTAANCKGFWNEGGASGALVGGASLDPEAFSAIARAAGKVEH